MKSDKNTASTCPIKKKFEVLTFPVAYLQMFFQTIMFKIYSK